MMPMTTLLTARQSSRYVCNSVLVINLTSREICAVTDIAFGALSSSSKMLDA